MTIPIRGLAAWILPVLASSLCVPAASGQTRIDLQSKTKNVDFSRALSTRPFPVGASLPATCKEGETWFKSGAPEGENLYLCTAENVWTVAQSSAGGTAPPYGMVKSLGVDSHLRMTCSDGAGPTNGECSLSVDTNNVVKPDGNNALSGITSLPASSFQTLTAVSPILCNATRVAVGSSVPLTLNAQPVIADPVRDGQVCMIQNVGAHDITLLSGVAHNLKLTASTMVVKAGHPLMLIWDQATSLWTQQVSGSSSGTTVSFGEALNLGEETQSGVAVTAARSDHRHKRTVQVAQSGFVAGTRGRINLLEGSNIAISASDDAANDEIDVTISASYPTQALSTMTDAVISNPQNNQCLIYMAAESRWRNVPCPGGGISAVTAAPGSGITATTSAGTVQLGLEASVARQNGANTFSAANSFPASPVQTISAPTVSILCNATRVAVSSIASWALTSTPTIADAARDGQLCIVQNTGTQDITLSSGVSQNLKLVSSTVKLAAGMFLPLVWDQATSLWTQQAGEAISFGNVLDLADTTAAGTSTVAARADHTHKRSVRVAKNGVTAGTRSRINLVEGAGISLAAADDLANDEIDVTINQKAAAVMTNTVPVCPASETELGTLTVPALGLGGMAKVTILFGKTVSANGFIYRVRIGDVNGQIIASLITSTTEVSGRVITEIHQQAANEISTFGLSVRENNALLSVFTPSGSGAAGGTNHPQLNHSSSTPVVLSITGRSCNGAESMFIRNAVVEVVKAQ